MEIKPAFGPTREAGLVWCDPLGFGRDDVGTKVANVFISYARDSADATEALARDLEALGHSVFWDAEIAGGEFWWDRILSEIRSADIFVAALDPSALASEACARELSYADALGLPVLPVAVSAEISPAALPNRIGKRHLVTYAEPGREDALRLARALAALPERGPPPNPLPVPPSAPVSSLTTLSDRLEADAPLDAATQAALLRDLRAAHRAGQDASHLRALLETMRGRADLLATSAEAIDALSAEMRPPPLRKLTPTLATTRRLGAALLRRAALSALAGIAGCVIGLLTLETFDGDRYLPDQHWAMPGPGLAMVAVIAGQSLVIWAGALGFGLVMVTAFADLKSNSAIAFVTAWSGYAMLGAVIGRLTQHALLPLWRYATRSER